MPNKLSDLVQGPHAMRNICIHSEHFHAQRSPSASSLLRKKLNGIQHRVGVAYDSVWISILDWCLVLVDIPRAPPRRGKGLAGM